MRMTPNINRVVWSVLGFLTLALPSSALAATAPSLGTTGIYGVAASTYTNANLAPQTIINGAECATTQPTTAPLTITGAVSTPCDPQVGLDQGAALNNVLDGLNTQACTPIAGALNAVIIGANPAGTFPPGCYETVGAMNITLGTTVTLDATALGGAGNVWIFRSSGALNTGDDSFISLMNGASASNVFWAPAGLATLGAFTTGGVPPLVPTFVGNILDAAGITLGHFANLSGRALAFGGTVTTDANTISVPVASATLHVIKLVVNASGGTAVPSSFTVHVKSGGVDVSGSPAAGASAPGTAYTLAAGTYLVSEDPNAAYVRTFTGDCDVSGSVSLAPGSDLTCTVVNTDIPPPPPAAPAGRSGGIIPLIGIVKVPAPLALTLGAGSVVYNYTVWNVGGQQALVDVAVNDDKCSPVVLVSGDINGNGKLDPAEIWNYRCTTTLGVTTTNTAVATGFGDDTDRTPAIATAIATVVVTPAVPALPNTGFPAPLINVLKVPSRLTPFPFGGGNVTYTYTVTNPGIVSMNNVTVIDNTCAPVTFINGDSNGNNLLDPGEAWIYSCTVYVPVSTRNIATAEGRANGFTALGYAFATVLVTAPGLPNTGLPPLTSGSLSDTVMAVSVMLVSLYAITAILKKRRT